MLENCFRFAPRDSIPGLIAKICKYLKDHPGWSIEEITEEINRHITEGVVGVASFNGRSGIVELQSGDVTSLKISSIYYGEGNETIDKLDLKKLYSDGIRVVFTDFNQAKHSYDKAYTLDYFAGSDTIVYYPVAIKVSSDVLSVNGKTGAVTLYLSDVLGDSCAQVKLCTANEFASTTINTWNELFDNGYRVVCVVNNNATAVDYLYILKQDKNNHKPIMLNIDGGDAATLNGKPGKYYIHPRNMLDNSDFTNPVNQRGNTSYTGTGYAIDRWENNSDACKLTVEDGCIHMQNNPNSASTETQFIRQKIENPSTLIGKTITIAARVKGNCRLGCEGIGLTYNDYTNYADWTTITLTVDISKMTGDYIAAVVQGPNKSEWYCSWAAIYEGRYTADTLPPYVQKGYASEFAECRRYYKRFTSPNAAIISAGHVTGGTKFIYINSPDNYPMRVNKPSCAFTGYITVRGINGYVADTYGDAAVSVYADTTGCISVLEVTRGDASAWNTTNNTPVIVQMHAGAVLELIADL